LHSDSPVIPAQVGIQVRGMELDEGEPRDARWIPAFAGMTYSVGCPEESATSKRASEGSVPLFSGIARQTGVETGPDRSAVIPAQAGIQRTSFDVPPFLRWRVRLVLVIHIAGGGNLFAVDSRA